MKQFFCPPAESGLDAAPPAGKIMISGWQRPDAVEMVGQQHPGINRKRVLSANIENSLPEKIPCLWQRKYFAPMIRHHRKKIGAAGNIGSPIGNHNSCWAMPNLHHPPIKLSVILRQKFKKEYTTDGPSFM
jgi:hypothetical protein